jgi:hypothetical protein
MLDPIHVKYDVILDKEREKDEIEYQLWDFIFTIDGDVVINNCFTAIHYI